MPRPCRQMNWPALHNMNTQLSKDSPMSRTSEEPKRVLILGLGNDILSDDAVGLLVARRLKHELSRFPGIAVLESSEMGLALLDFITGYSAVLIIDSIQTGQAAAGSVHELDGSHRVEVLRHRNRQAREPKLVHEALQDVEHRRLRHGRHAGRARVAGAGA